MARNGAGTYVLPLADVVANTTILAAWANATLADVAAALTASIAKDGQTQPTANLPMNGFKHTGAAAGTANGQYYRYDEVQSVLMPALTVPNWGGTAGGTVNAATITVSPAITAYAAGQEFAYRSLGRNTTGTPTINVNGLGAKNILRNGASAGADGSVTWKILPGDIPDGIVLLRYDGTNMRLINPDSLRAGRVGRLIAYLTSNQLVADNSSEKLVGWTELFDENSNFNTTTGIYTIPASGTYRITAQATLLNVTGDPTEYMQCIIGNDTLLNIWLRGSSCALTTAIAEYLVSYASGLVDLSTGDQICMYVRHRTGTDRNFIAGKAFTRLQAELVDYFPAS